MTCNGADMTLSAEINESTAEYTSPAVTGDSTVVIAFRATEPAEPAPPQDETPADDTQNPGDSEGKSSGCGCGGALAGTLALSAAALAVFVKKPF